MDKEIWKDIKGYEGLYQASNLGNIKSLGRTFENKGSYSGYCTTKDKILKPRPCSRYYKVALYKDSKRKDYLLHRIIAETFIENTENKPYVNHKDENCFNNNANNLMWCTHKENMNWGTRNKRIALKNTNNPKRCKKVIQYDLNGNFIKEYSSIKEACKELNIKNKHIGQCCKKHYGRKTVSGYKWEFADDKNTRVD